MPTEKEKEREQAFYNFFNEKKGYFEKKILQPTENTIGDFQENYFLYILGSLIVLFLCFLFICILFNPYNITTIFPRLFTIISVVIVIVLSLLFTSELDKNDHRVQVMKEYKIEILYGFIYVFSFFLIFCLFYYIVKKLLLYSSGNSLLFVGIFTVLCLSLLYSVNKNFVKTSKVLRRMGILRDILFVIPCLIVDVYEFITNDIKNTPSTSVVIILIMIFMITMFIVIPLIQSIKIRNKDYILLLKKPNELDKEVVYVSQEELKKRKINNKPYFEKKLLQQTEILKNTLNEYKNSSVGQLNSYNAYENRKIYDTNGTDYTLVKNLTECVGKTVNCDDGYITCTDIEDSNKKTIIANAYGMYETCNTDGLVYSSLFEDKNELLNMYSDISKTQITTLNDYCSTNLGSGEFNIQCVNFEDNSNMIIDTSDGTFIETNSGELITQNVLTCDDLLEDQDSTMKYTLIHGYNDICNSEIAFQCDSGIGGRGVNISCGNIIESFVSAYNPRVHQLDKNIKNINFMNALSPEENKIIENAIKNDNNNLLNKLNQLTNPEDIKQLYLEYLSSNQSYSSVMASINEMNQGATNYIYQESSNLVDMINRQNNINDYNYHYGLSFWVYFDSELLKGGNEEREGVILNYAYAPYMYYDSKIQELIIEINDCDRKMSTQKSDIVCEKRKIIYKSNNILFQRWNHFVINYDYGTMDIFINNNLVATQKNVSPYIQTNENSIQFGSNTNRLKNCGICNIRYYNIPLNLTQIRNIYGNKNNPCK